MNLKYWCEQGWIEEADVTWEPHGLESPCDADHGLESPCDSVTD